MHTDGSTPQKSESSSSAPSNAPEDRTPLPATSTSIKDASQKSSVGAAQLEINSLALSGSTAQQSAQSLIDKSRKIRAEKRLSPEQHQEDLADFYRAITLDNPDWRAMETVSANNGKIALEKVKIGARLHIDTKPVQPATVIQILQVSPTGEKRMTPIVVGPQESGT